jgi:hypothetical protein
MWSSIQVETLSREDLASRLTLTVDAASVGSLLLADSFITIIDVSYLNLITHFGLIFSFPPPPQKINK